MAKENTIEISGIPIKFRASAAALRVYRDMFGRDLLVDFQTLQESYSEAKKNKARVMNMEILENIAYVLAKIADPDGVADTPAGWLDQFDGFALYDALPEIVALWTDSAKTMSTAKKKAAKPQGK